MILCIIILYDVIITIRLRSHLLQANNIYKGHVVNVTEERNSRRSHFQRQNNTPCNNNTNDNDTINSGNNNNNNNNNNTNNNNNNNNNNNSGNSNDINNENDYDHQNDNNNISQDLSIMSSNIRLNNCSANTLRPCQPISNRKSVSAGNSPRLYNPNSTRGSGQSVTCQSHGRQLPKLPDRSRRDKVKDRPSQLSMDQRSHSLDSSFEDSACPLPRDHVDTGPPPVVRNSYNALDRKQETRELPANGKWYRQLMTPDW